MSNVAAPLNTLYSVVPSGPIVTKDGEMTQSFRLFLQQLINTLQTNAGLHGVAPMKLTTAQIDVIQGYKPVAPQTLNTTVGNIVYNTTTQMMMLNNSGTFQNITVS